MLIGLYGHGYIGSAIARELENQGANYVWLSHRDKPVGDVIINAAGYTGTPNVDACESHKEECIDGNILWPLRLQKQHREIIHIGSGCIYTDGSYGEEDKPNFKGSFYSLCKALGQEALEPLLYHSYLLRVRMPFSGIHHQKNLFDKLAKYPRLVNHTNSMTCLEDIARIAIWFAKNQPAPGVYNVANPGFVTTRYLADVLGITPEWFTEEEFLASVAAPRSKCILNVDKLHAVYRLPDIETAVLNAAFRWRRS